MLLTRTSYPCLRTVRAMLCSASAKNRLDRSGTTTPTVSVLPVIMLRARLLGRYPSSAATLATLSLVRALTSDAPASARPAVDFETPAALATSMMVTVWRDVMAPTVSARSAR